MEMIILITVRITIWSLSACHETPNPPSKPPTFSASTSTTSRSDVGRGKYRRQCTDWREVVDPGGITREDQSLPEKKNKRYSPS